MRGIDEIRRLDTPKRTTRRDDELWTSIVTVGIVGILAILFVLLWVAVG